MKKKVLLFTITFVAVMSAGCQKAEEPQPEAQVQEENASIPEENVPTPEQSLQDTEGPEQTPQDAETSEPEIEASDTFSFADVDNLEFYFSSGAGGWYTVLHIHADGTFDGHYQDSDMGVTDSEYPGGTMYYSDFSGSFTQPEKVDDTTYVFQISSIEYPLGFGEEIRDGIHYCYTEGYGLDEAQDLYLYLPGANISDLPEEYLSWVGYYNPEGISETELPFYGLYNETKEAGFSSYEASSAPSDEGSETAAEEIDRTLQNAEAKAEELEQELQSAQTQEDLNSISGELFTVWDDALNAVWTILTENLDSETMETLTEEERNWIAEKEAAVQEAGAEAEGGSMYSLIVNRKAAEMTKERVYELAEYPGVPES